MSKILLIDDNADNLTSLSATLKDLIPKSVILVALSGPEGLELAADKQPDVIILDIRMPGMNGYEVLRLLKANVKTKIIPVILLTANYTDVKSKIRGLEAGADAFLSKPIDKNELIAQVKVMLRIKKAEDLLRRENILLESVAKGASQKFDFTQKKYQNVFDNNLAGIVETTFEGEILSCNTSLAKIFGFKTVEEVLELKTIPFYKNVSDRDKLVSLLKKDKKILNYEVDFVDKNGKTINALIRSFNIDEKTILTFFIDITDVKKLQETQNQYEKIVSSSTDMMALLDKNFTYLACNNTFFEAFGKTSEEIIGSTVEDIFGKEFFESVTKPNALRCLAGEVINYQKWFDFPVKGKCYMDVRFFPYKDKQNIIQGFVVNARDITKHKKIENALKESEQWNKEIFEGSLDAIFIVDSNAHIVDVNKAAASLTGYTKDELLKMSIPALHEEEDLEAFNKYFRRIMDGEPITSEAKIRRKDGTKVDTEFSNKRIIIGRVPYMHTIARDITERKKIEEMLMLVHFSTEHTKDAIYWIIPNGNFVNVNETACKELGYTKEELLQMSVFDVAPSFPRENWNSHWEELKEKGSMIFENTHLRKDGTTFPVEISVNYIKYGNKEYNCAFARDITERKLSEEKLGKEKALLKAIVDNIPILLTRYDPNTNILYLNKEFEKKVGWKTEEVKNIDLLEKVYPDPDYRQQAIEYMQKASIEWREFRVRSKSGKIVDSEWANIRLQDGTQIGIGIDITERKKNEEEIKQKNKQLLLLSKASTEINKVLDLDTILQQLVKIAIELTGSTSGASALYENDKMVFRTYNNKGKIIPIDFEFEKGYGVPGWVIKNKKPYITNDAKNDEHVIPEIQKELNFHQLIDVPILNKKGELLGCFEIHNTKDGRPYDDNDMEILQGLAANTSVAIENTQMFLERKKIEEVLSFERDKFSFILNSLPIGVTVLDSSDKYIFINSISLEIDRYPKDPSKLLGKDVRSNHPKNALSVIDELINDFKSGKKTHHFREDRKGKKDVLISYHSLHNSEGKYTGLIRLVTDITERKQAELKVRESRQRLSSHLDNTPLGGIFWDTDLKVTDWNKSAERIFGYSKEEALGKHANELIVPKEIQNKIDDIFNHLLTQTGGERSTDENITKEGKRIICDWYNVAITDANGKVTGVASLVDDITERKKTEKELKTRNRELQIFYDAAVGRELKVIELKKEINELLEKSGRNPKYELPV